MVKNSPEKIRAYTESLGKPYACQTVFEVLEAIMKLPQRCDSQIFQNEE